MKGENNKVAALNTNVKDKTKLFHMSTAQQVLPHRVFILSMQHTARAIRIENNDEGNLNQPHLKVYRCKIRIQRTLI